MGGRGHGPGRVIMTQESQRNYGHLRYVITDMDSQYYA